MVTRLKRSPRKGCTPDTLSGDLKLATENGPDDIEMIQFTYVMNFQLVMSNIHIIHVNFRRHINLHNLERGQTRYEVNLCNLSEVN